MRKIILVLVLAALSTVAHAQTSCTISNPCVSVTITNSSMTLAGSAILWKCQGGTTSCSQAALTTAQSTQSATNLCPSGTSVWACVSFAQTTTTAKYNDAEPYGALMNYAAQNAFTGGAAGPTSSIAIFQVPVPIPTVPSVSAAVTTSGSTGPQ